MMLCAIAIDCPRSSAPRPGIGAGRVDERHDRHAELRGVAHQPQRLAVALRIRHAEVAQHHLLRRVALLVADDHHRPLAELREPADDRGVLLEEPVAEELLEVVEDVADVLERVRPVDVARELDDLPRVADLQLLGVGDRRRAVHLGEPIAAARRPARAARGSCAGRPAASRAPRRDRAGRGRSGSPRSGSRPAASAGSSARSPSGRRSRCSCRARRRAGRRASRRTR